MLLRSALCVTAFLLGAAACGGGGRPVEVEGTVRDQETGRPLANARVEAPGGRQVQTDAEGNFRVTVESGRGRVLVASVDGYCRRETRIDVAAPGSGGRVENTTLHLPQRFAPPSEQLSQVGFDQEVRVTARVRCGEPQLSWEQTSGATLEGDSMRTEDDGATLVVRTPRLSDQVALSARPGIIAFDRVQRGDFRFRLTARFGDEPATTHEVRITATTYAGGFYQVPTGGDVYFNGGEHATHQWELQSETGNVELFGADTRTPHFRPGLFGTYFVNHQTTGTSFMVQAGGYSDVPRDCGRQGCHYEQNEGWERTAHATTFRRGLEGELGAEFEERCWSCHAGGVDPGVNNGGLHQVARREGWEQPTPGAGVFEAAPRRVRRHGTVWCTDCHGPGRILPPSYHWEYQAKFQAGLCARCHNVPEDDPDSTHRSPNVEEWRLAAMSTFSREGERNPARQRVCASCHSAQGFVGWLRSNAHPPPLEAPDNGINLVEPVTCPTCHDPHDATNPRGLRAYNTVDNIGGRSAEGLGAGAICAHCHRNDEGEDALVSAPHAPQANLLMGRGARTVRRASSAVHGEVANACVSCHMARPPEDSALYAQVGGHTFSIHQLGPQAGADPALNPAACASCHQDTAPERIGVSDRNGDGTSSTLREEFDTTFASLMGALRARLDSLVIADSCTPARRAAQIADHDARLVLVDAQGVMLGDCDGDGVFSTAESPTEISALPARMRGAVWDLAMIGRDGSRGAHNPAYTFAIANSVRRALGAP